MVVSFVDSTIKGDPNHHSYLEKNDIHPARLGKSKTKKVGSQ